MTLKQQAFSGIRWSTLAKGVSAVGSIVQLYILIRFIEPADFGLMAMVNVSLYFTLNFLDFGINNGIIHKTEISPRQLSSLYWFTVLLGLVLSILFYLSAPLIVWFYQEERLLDLLQILALVFILNALGNQFRTLLLKALRFNLLAAIEVWSFLTGFALTVFLAVKGYGVYALVYGSLAKTSVEALASIWWGRASYRLQGVLRLDEVRFFLHFGLYQMGERLLNFFNQQIDVILIGKLLGPDILGVYDVIKRFLLRPAELINPIITGVCFPLMAKVQDQAQQLASIYLQQLQYICSLNFPIYVLLFFAAEPVMTLMFGESWLVHLEVFQLYIIVAMSYSTGNPVGTLILARGRVALGFFWNLILFFIIPLVVYFGATWELRGVLLALVATQLLLIFPNYYFLVRPLIPTRASIYFGKMGLPLLLALVAVGTSTLLGTLVFETALWQLLTITTFTGVFYLLLNWFFNRRFVLDLKALLTNER